MMKIIWEKNCSEWSFSGDDLFHEQRASSMPFRSNNGQSLHFSIFENDDRMIFVSSLTENSP